MSKRHICAIISATSCEPIYLKEQGALYEKKNLMGSYGLIYDLYDHSDCLDDSHVYPNGPTDRSWIFTCVPIRPYYDGLYIDLVQEADYQNYLDNGDSAADSHIIKISNDTGYLACASASSGDLEIVYPKFVHEGVPVELRFENRVLTGYRLTYEGEIQSMLGAREQIALTEDDQTTIEDVALELAWNDETWVTDQPSLEAVLVDYMEQVDAFVAENGPHTNVTL